MSDDPVYKSATDIDLLPVVDENDQVIGALARREIHLRNLRHRAVHIVVVNGRGEILLQHRSALKDRFPGWWDISVGGHVDAGEEYDEAARRELGEEMGIEAPLRQIGQRSADAESGWEFVRLYECLFDGEPCFDRNEITGVRWVNPSEFLAKAHSDPAREDYRVTTSGLISLRLWARAAGIRCDEE